MDGLVRHMKFSYDVIHWYIGGKASAYVELVSDGNPLRKTDVVKKNWNPRWDDDFNVYGVPDDNLISMTFLSLSLSLSGLLL